MNDRLEEQLRSSLNRTADARPITGPDLGDVFGRARSIRRRRTAFVAGAAATAVIAVVVPTTVILSDDHGGGSGLTPATSSPATSAPATSSPSTSGPSTSGPSASASTADETPRGLGIGGISIGEHTQYSYLDPQQHLHGGGSLSNALLKHGGAALSGYTPYHGGWVLTYIDADWIMQVDGSGHVVREGRGDLVTTSSDGLRTAFQIGRTVYAGIASGMSDGEQVVHLAPDEALVGFLGDGIAISNGTGVTVVTSDGGRTGITDALVPTAVSQVGNLIGGVQGTPAAADQEGVMADGTTGDVLWHGEWQPMAFSQDGRYVAAVPVVDNGDPSAYAILDARTGAVLARTPASIADRIYLGLRVVWESDDAILFQGFEASGEHRAALLRLTTDGLFNQASEPLAPVTTDQGQISFVLMTR